MSESAEIARAVEWREQIGVAALLATTCTHDGDEFGPRAVCETCFGNVQSICNAVLQVVERAIVSVAPPLNSELRHDGSEDPFAAAYVEGFKDAHDALCALRLPPAPECQSCRDGSDLAAGWECSGCGRNGDVERAADPSTSTGQADH